MQTNQKELPPIYKEHKLQKIANGTQTTIYKCLNQEEMHDDKILKCVIHSTEAHLQSCRNLKHEYELLQQLDHPYIIKSQKYNTLKEGEDEFCVIEIESCEYDLYHYCAMNFPKANIKQVVGWFKQIIQALAYLHAQKKIVHLDIKPENIMIDYKGEAKLIDFGHSIEIDQINNENFRASWMKRSKLYMAPEMLRFSRMVDKKEEFDVLKYPINWRALDVFSVGITFFSVVFFKSPFESDRVSRSTGLYQYVFKNDYHSFRNVDDQVKSMSALYREDFEHFELFMEVIWSMIRYDYSERISMEELLTHQLFK